MMTSTQRKEITVGQKVYLYHGDWRTEHGRYSMPLPVIKVTATQFTVAAENMDSKPRRFMKSNGHEVGKAFSRHSPSVTLVTPESSREVNKFNREKKAKAQELSNKAYREEMALREKYKAQDITDEGIQARFLKPLRSLAEDGEHEMSNLLESFEGVSIDAENFYRVTDAVRRETDNGYFAYGLKVRDYGRDQHANFVNLIEEFETGTRYQIGSVEVKSLEELLVGATHYVVRCQMQRFFDWGRATIDEADQKFIGTMRDILNDEDIAPRITKIKEGE